MSVGFYGVKIPGGTGLFLSPVSQSVAADACRRWHYSGSMGATAVCRLGVWEEGDFVGVVAFNVGANRNIGKPFDIDSSQCCELVRVALSRHAAPVSRIVAVAIKLFGRVAPGIRLIVSYADPEMGHVGRIYQACNWIYTGQKKRQENYLVGGVWRHGRSAHSLIGTVKGLPRKYVDGKHCYVMPLDAAIRTRVERCRMPFPRVASIAGDAPPSQGGQGGSIPTATLVHDLPSSQVNAGEDFPCQPPRSTSPSPPPAKGS